MNNELALKIAYVAHKGQVDKGGLEYINHPLTVASLVKTNEEKIVAILHDIIEDTKTTIEELKLYNFSDDIINAIDCLTKKQNQSYEEYKEKIKTNKLAIKVKIADLIHNMDMSRLNNVTKEDIERNIKYNKFLLELIKI